MKYPLRINSFLITFLLVCGFYMPNSFAAHLIGGEMTYQCISADQYVVNLTLYRDCDGGGADFDSNGTGLLGSVTVYRGNVIFIRTVNLPTPIVSAIPTAANPCLQATPENCVEQGIYQFNLVLPASTETYSIVYQRCCRTVNSANIISSGDIGKTYFVQINADAQNICNDSPVFAHSPKIVICANQDLFVDHRVTDNSNNSNYIYSLCAPLIGGGLGGLDGNIVAQMGPNGIAPDPDLPPPYQQVTYVQPTYGFDHPLGGNPALSIHPTSGQITGHPIATGQFVVGVCVQEFQNGVLFSEISRDFLYTVIDCLPQVSTVIDTSVTAGSEIAGAIINQDTSFTFVHVNPADGCDSFVTYDIQVLLRTNETHAESIQIFPNPFNETLNFQITAENIQHIKLRNSQGELISRFTDGFIADYSISTMHLPAGLYFVEIQTAHGSHVSRVVKY